jgi:hypothetical protein
MQVGLFIHRKDLTLSCDIPYTIIFPNHGSKELGKGLMIKLLKEAKINP